MALSKNEVGFRTGYMVPRSMEWMFYPLGYVAPEKPVANSILARQFTITNGDEFMAVLAKLGVVREQRK